MRLISHYETHEPTPLITLRHGIVERAHDRRAAEIRDEGGPGAPGMTAQA